MERRATTNDCENCTEKNICEVQNMMNNYGLQCKMFSPYRPSTNYDRIRQMTDEELARFIHSLYMKIRRCPEDRWYESECLNRTCDSCWLEWLKSPVEVDDVCSN